MRRLHFKPSLAEAKRSTQKAMDYYRALSPNADAARFDAGAKSKRERGPVNVAESEAPVQAAIGELLASHPSVAIAIRINGGMAYSETGAPVWFHRLIRVPGIQKEYRLTDFVGILKSGRPFAIEAKRPDWSGVSRGTRDQALREQAQERYMNYVIALGGVAGFARSMEEALAIVEGKK